MRRLLDLLNPAVPRFWLPPIAGGMWAAVGAMLIGRAAGWIRLLPPLGALAASAGAALAAWWLARRFFLPLVDRNLERLAARPERSCVFGVFPWRSWLMVVLMVSLGISLRRWIPPAWLVPPYVCMGLCLWAGALRYLDAWRRSD